MTSIDFKQQAEALRDELIARRRDFHRFPELGFEEHRTAGIVADTLRGLGLEVQTGVGKTGVVGILEGDKDGPTVLVRADMDALPVREENTFEYVSSTENKMHACGHDGHTAIALGVAKLLSQRRDEMAGRVKFVFQPAEEIGLGAKAMVQDGVLENPRPDVTVGLHLWNPLPMGVLGVASGPVMAGASTFDIRITGKGGHAALPHLNIDPIVCAAQLITAIQTIPSRNIDPMQGSVITVTYVRGGETHNVTPQDVHLRGTMRFFKHEVRDVLERRMHDVTEMVCRSMGCKGDLHIERQTEPVINNPDVSARLRRAFEPIVGAANLDTSARTMGAEDVGLLMSDIPGMYFFVGARDVTQDAYYGHHHPRFSIDEDALPLGVALLSTAVASYVLPDSE